MKVLGITLRGDFKMVDHVDRKLATCSQSLFALKTLRNHGPNNDSLWDVCRATTISKLMYASPAWVGFAQSSDCNRIEAFIRNCKRLGFLNINDPTAVDLFHNADIKLFSKIVADKRHVLHSFTTSQK